MKKQLHKYILFLLLFLPVYVFAQSTKPADHDMTGLWKGTLYNDSTKKFLPYEIAISEEKGKLVGYSYTLFEEDGKKEVGVKRIKLKIKNDEVVIEDVEMISNNYSIAPPKKVRVQSILSLYLNDTSMQMSGRWSTNKTWEYRQLTGNLQVIRAIDYKETALFERLTELKLLKDLSFVQPDKNSTGADIAMKEKPVKEKKLPIETQDKSADAEKQREVIAAPDTKTDIVAGNKEIRKEVAKTEDPTSKKVVDIQTKPKPVADEKSVVVVDNKPTDKAVVKTDSPVSKTTIDQPTKTQTLANGKSVVAINNKPTDKAVVRNDSPLSKTGIDQPTKTQPVAYEKTVVVADNKPVDKAMVKTDSPNSKTTIDQPTKTKPVANDKIVVVSHNKPTDKAMVKTDSPVSKIVIDQPTNVVDKKVVVPGPTNEVVIKEKKPVNQSIAKNTSVEKPSSINPDLPGKKTNIATKDSTAKNGTAADVVTIKPADKAKPAIVPPVDKKKEVVVALNEGKTSSNQPAVVSKPAVVPPPVTKQPAPNVALKEPARKDDQPAATVAKTQTVVEKPLVIDVPKEPVKTETKAVAVEPAPAEKKKEIPVEVTAPVVVAAPIVVAAANVADRKMKNEQAVFFESDSLVLTLYDNGEVDGDTVSVLMNGQIIFAKQGLSTKANSKTIYIDKNMSDSLSMVMYAENLGSIPPNTGLLIIMDGEKRYEVRFSADLQTNAAILLRRKLKEN